LVSGFASWRRTINKPDTGLNALIRPIERLLCVVIVRNRNHPAKRKDVICAGTCLNPAGIEMGIDQRDLIASSRIRVHKGAAPVGPR
jgi:hypothetical protein